MLICDVIVVRRGTYCAVEETFSLPMTPFLRKNFKFRWAQLKRRIIKC